MAFKSNQELYEFVGTLAEWLRLADQPVLAADLAATLRSGSTSGEVLGNIGVELRRILDAGACKGSEYEPTLEDALSDVRSALGGHTFF